MTSTNVTSLDLCAVRVSQVTTSGAPATGASTGFVSTGAVSLSVKTDTEAGLQKTQRNGCGTLCAVLDEPDLIRNLTLSAEFCQLDAILLSLLTGCTLISSGGNAIGMQLPAVGTAPTPVCFEGWSLAWNTTNTQVVTSYTSPLPTYIHWVFPFNRWVLGDFKLEHDLMVIPAEGKASENSKITADGPFNDWPAPVVALGGITRLGGWFYDSTLPTATNDYVAVTSAAS